MCSCPASAVVSPATAPRERSWRNAGPATATTHPPRLPRWAFRALSVTASDLNLHTAYGASPIDTALPALGNQHKDSSGSIKPAGRSGPVHRAVPSHQLRQRTKTIRSTKRVKDPLLPRIAFVLRRIESKDDSSRIRPAVAPGGSGSKKSALVTEDDAGKRATPIPASGEVVENALTPRNTGWRRWNKLENGTR